MSVRSTVKAIIIDNNRILLNKCHDPFNGDYYSLPGGGQDKYETIHDAIVRECLEETGYTVLPTHFCGICEEICDNEDTRINYSKYAHKLYHIFQCKLKDSNQISPSSIDDMQIESEWINISDLKNIRILPVMIQQNIKNLISTNPIPQYMGSIHIPYNHG